MAGIKSLSVRGIRSFGPDDSDEQRISFDKPLTLILGQNGCGKTTIIECLRYAVTGQMPPGSRNECFVHDAKINRSTEVLAQVKLKMINAKDKQLEISRSMKVTALKMKKSKFQTLDSFLSLIDDDGKVKDISSRCADIDNMVQEDLGVSKAILNSVIFCHQEDSSWPLDEGKKVKERFDEIFDADKYSDCFERLRKIRKEYSINIKMLTQEVESLGEQKEELDKKKLDVINTETQISESELKVAELAKELEPITKKIVAIEELQKNLVKLESDREKIKTKLEHRRTQETELKATIKTVFEGTMQELQSNISNYASTFVAKKKELDVSQKRIMNFNREEEKMANEMSSNEVKFNKFMLLESQNQERIDNKYKMIVETGQLAELEMNEVTNADEAVTAIGIVTDKIKSLRNELKEQKSIADGEENKVQALVNDCRDALSRHKQKISGKNTEIQKIKKEIASTEKEIKNANDAKEKLDKMETRLKTAEDEYESAAASMNVEESQKEINDDEKSMDEQQTELDALDKQITQLQKQSAKMKVKEMSEESLNNKEKQLNVLKNKHRTAITEILGEMPENGFTLKINKFEQERRSEVDGIKKKKKSKQLELTKLESERNHVREMLNGRKAELTKAEDQMYKACGTQSYEDTLAKVTTSVEKLNEDQNLLKSSLFIFAKYKEQLKDNSCCPLCNRNFEAESDVSDLLTDLTTKVMNVPSKLEQVTEELQKASAKKDDLISMKSLNEKIKSLKETDIPQLETRLSDVDKKIADATTILEELATSIKDPEQKMQTAKQIQGDMPLIDRYIKDVEANNKELEALKAECADFDTTTNLEEAMSKQTALREAISTLRTKIKTCRNKLNAHNKKLNTMADKKNKIKEEMLNIQKKVQEIVTLQESVKQLESNIEKCQQELKELQEGIPELEEALKVKEEEKKELVSKNRGEVEAKNFYITKIENSFEKVRSIEKEIKAHEDKNVPREMEKIKLSNEKLMEKKMQIMRDRDEITKKIENLKDELNKQEVNKRDLDDNLKLRKAQNEAEQFEKDLKQIEENLSGMNMDSISEKEELLVKQTQLYTEKAQTSGQLKQQKDELKRNKADMTRLLNKNIEKKYRDRFYNLHVTKAIDKDIRDYSVALEKCLMEYHREKMENINLIIREMWRKIYRGNDIDYIEIKTEGSMTADSERRKYDYRVVQCKNGVEIDMRGRCSAGQKVLACLIIRLALAETFSSRFGILALDEPTTNLDQENIRSLCGALGEIVQERMRQKNFMFIIITHDKEFIESLGNIDKVSHYYEVSRNDDGKSRIKKIRFT